jgi:4-hydroxy-4-methyl-2-oxoglutarate aldolase
MRVRRTLPSSTVIRSTAIFPQRECARSFPTWSCGTYAQDQGQRGKVVDFRLAIEIDGVEVQPGDILFGDRDGVVVIPQSTEEDVVRRSVDKVSTDNQVRRAIEQGLSAVEAYSCFGVM